MISFNTSIRMALQEHSVSARQVESDLLYGEMALAYDMIEPSPFLTCWSSASKSYALPNKGVGWGGTSRDDVHVLAGHANLVDDFAWQVFLLQLVAQDATDLLLREHREHGELHDDRVEGRHLPIEDVVLQAHQSVIDVSLQGKELNVIDNTILVAFFEVL
jgi:hypothetical protein